MISWMGTIVAAGDPMSHVLDSWFIHGVFSKHMLMLAVAAGLCLWLFPMIAQRIEGGATGGRLTGLFEVLLVFIRDDVAKPFLGKDTNRFLPIIWSFFFFILFCNLLGLIPFSATATGNLAVTGGLATVSFVIYHGAGIKQNGFVPYVKAMFLVGPPFLWPLMILVEAMGHIIKPVALMIRLFANMMAGHVMLAVIIGIGAAMGVAVGVVTGSAAVLLMFLELLVAFIQAFIFTFLTTVFLSMSLHPDH